MSQSKPKYRPIPTEEVDLPEKKESLKSSKVTSNKKLFIAGGFFLIVLAVCLLLKLKLLSKSPEKKGRCSQQWY